jgi:hypothetical protein
LASVVARATARATVWWTRRSRGLGRRGPGSVTLTRASEAARKMSGWLRRAPALSLTGGGGCFGDSDAVREAGSKLHSLVQELNGRPGPAVHGDPTGGHIYL